MKKFLIIVAGIVVGGLLLMGGCLAVLGGAASEIDDSMTEDTVSADQTSPGAAAKETEDYSWKGLKVAKDEFGYFTGSIKVTNNTDDRADVFVEVTAYDGQQTLGALMGSTKIKPGATTTVDLEGFDEFAKATDYDVEITGGL